MRCTFTPNLVVIKCDLDRSCNSAHCYPCLCIDITIMMSHNHTGDTYLLNVSAPKRYQVRSSIFTTKYIDICSRMRRCDMHYRPIMVEHDPGYVCSKFHISCVLLQFLQSEGTCQPMTMYCQLPSYASQTYDDVVHMLAAVISIPHSLFSTYAVPAHEWQLHPGLIRFGATGEASPNTYFRLFLCLNMFVVLSFTEKWNRLQL